MRPSLKISAVVGGVTLLSATCAYAQFGGGGADWNTAGLNAQRTSWVKTDKYITPEALKSGNFKLQWTVKLKDTAPVIGATSSGGGLSKPLNVILTRSNTLTTVDNDTGIEGWSRHFNVPAAPASAACPAGMTAAGSRSVQLVPRPAPPSPFAVATPAVGYSSILGEPGQGLPASATMRAIRIPGAQPPATAGAGAPLGAPAPVAPPRPAGALAGNDFVPTAAAPATYKSYFAGGRFGSNSGFFILTSDGMLRTIADSNGVELKAPVQFLPPSAHASDLTVIPENNAAWHAYVVYTSTTNSCGGVPNRVWALNLADDNKPVTHFDTVANPVGDLAFLENGTVIVAVGKGPANATYANSVVALAPKSLEPKAWFTDSSADFSATPTIIKVGSREVIAEASKDGRIFLLDAQTPGGEDHKTALFISPAYSIGKGKFTPAGLATWQDVNGATYVAEPFEGPGPAGMSGKLTKGGIVTLKVSDEGARVSLAPVWVSSDMSSPLTPMVVNGVMFAASSGESKSNPAVLYALDPATGKQMWSSDGSIASTVSNTPLWSQGSQVYVATSDGAVYAFGPSQERYTLAAR